MVSVREKNTAVIRWVGFRLSMSCDRDMRVSRAISIWQLKIRGSTFACNVECTWVYRTFCGNAVWTAVYTEERLEIKIKSQRALSRPASTCRNFPFDLVTGARHSVQSLWEICKHRARYCYSLLFLFCPLSSRIHLSSLPPLSLPPNNPLRKIEDANDSMRRRAKISNLPFSKTLRDRLADYNGLLLKKNDEFQSPWIWNKLNLITKSMYFAYGRYKR